MADRKTGNQTQDARTVSGEQDYEVRYFAKQNGISVEQTRELIKKHGNDRAVLTAEAKKLNPTGIG